MTDPLPDTRSDHTTSTHVAVLRLPYAGGPDLAGSHRRCRACALARSRSLRARLADRQFQRVARSVRVRFRFQFADDRRHVIQAEVRAVSVIAAV